MKYLVTQAKKTYFEKIVSNETDNTCLFWKALNALTKNTFTSSKQNIPGTLTAEIFDDHLLSLAKTLTKTHQRGLPPLRLMLISQVIEQVSEHCHLGVILDDQLKWQAHVNSITNAVAKNVYLLSHLRHFCNSEACNTFFSRSHYVQN